MVHLCVDVNVCDFPNSFSMFPAEYMYLQTIFFLRKSAITIKTDAHLLHFEIHGSGGFVLLDVYTPYVFSHLCKVLYAYLYHHIHPFVALQ